MDTNKRKRLREAGWRVGSTEEFLGLSPEEGFYIDMKLKLSDKLATFRAQAELTQAQVARRIQGS